MRDRFCAAVTARPQAVAVQGLHCVDGHGAVPLAMTERSRSKQGAVHCKAEDRDILSGLEQSVWACGAFSACL